MSPVMMDVYILYRGGRWIVADGQKRKTALPQGNADRYRQW